MPQGQHQSALESGDGGVGGHRVETQKWFKRNQIVAKQTTVVCDAAVLVACDTLDPLVTARDLSLHP